MRLRPTAARAIAAVAWLLASAAGIATAQDVEGERSETPPKVAVVVVGDADEVLRAEAVRIEEALRQSPELALPSDPALRRALRGEPAPDEDDGLGRARRERRQLGLGEEADVPVLAALGRMAGAVAVVGLRRRGAAIEAVVLDVERGSFFEGELDAGRATDEEVSRFVRTRAEGAQRAAREAEARPPEPEAAPASDPVEAERGETGERGEERPAQPLAPPAGGPTPEEEEDDGGFLDHLPLIVAGVLLVGAILLFTLDDEPAAPGPPVLRFVPGGR